MESTGSKSFNVLSKGLRTTKDSATSKYRQESASEKLARQIFVGGLPASVNEAKFRQWAEELWPGAVITVQIIYTKPMERNQPLRPRGFGFVTFDQVSTVTSALENCHRPFANKIVELKKAEDCRGKKPPPRGKRDELHPSHATSEHSNHDNVAAKRSTTFPSFPSGPAELGSLATDQPAVIRGSKSHDSAPTSQPAAAAAGDESQGPVHKDHPPGSPARAPSGHSPRPQGPQCGTTPALVMVAAPPSGSRRAAAATSGKSTERHRARHAGEKVQSTCGEGAARAGHAECVGAIAVATGGGECAVGCSVDRGPAGPAPSATSAAPCGSAKPVYDDAIRQLLRSTGVRAHDISLHCLGQIHGQIHLCHVLCALAFASAA